MDNINNRMRCAIYTRKSSEEGLEQSFNSLHAQREACAAFILSQRHEGWSLVETAYDDGAFSGGTMDRPALKALLADIGDGKVDVVVVYKIDRLTRSLFDFAKIVETFDAQKVSFVSVTQAFNTTTSMGRLTLNVLLSFAQFEREVTGERIRDKFAASKKRGMWMGGNIPLGYDLVGRKLVVNEVESEQVRTIFRLYAKHGTVLEVQRELERLKIRTKIHTSQTGKTRGGRPFHGSHLYWILHSRLYRGEVNHRGAIYPGEHEPIVDQALWDAVQASFASNAAVRRSGTAIKQPSLLVGLLFDGKGGRMGSHHACKPGKEYRYYLSDSLMAEAKRKRPNDVGEGLRLPAQEIENHVIATVAAFLADTQKLIAECCPKGTPPSVSNVALRQAATLAALLKTGGAQEHYELMRSVVKRVQVFEKSICITLGRQPLAAQLQIPVSATADEPDAPLELSVPAELRRIGKEKRLIVAALVPKTNPDAILIKAIVRAHLWFGMLRDRKVTSISELAEAEKLPRTYVGSVIPFAFLAPDITEAILNGTQPIDLNLDRLINATLPLDWAKQRTLLGFN